MRRVQSLQNAAARFITGARRRDHITPMLRQLQWLPVRSRVEFKLAFLVHQALCDQMPTYLADDIRLVSEGNRRSLRSSFDNMCAVPRTHNSFGDRSFGAAGPRIWNSLPRGLRTLDISYKHCKTLLKTFLTRPRNAFVTFIGYISALEILLLTYLLTYLLIYLLICLSNIWSIFEIFSLARSAVNLQSEKHSQRAISALLNIILQSNRT